MKNPYKRKKEPEQVKAEIIKATIELASNQSFDGVSLQAIADLANVTKGGLLHHFPSKKTLIHSIFVTELKALDTEIDRLIAEDSEPLGSFTRAYIKSNFSALNQKNRSIWQFFATSILSDDELRSIWWSWLGERLKRHRRTDSVSRFEIARLATDGAWYMILSSNIEHTKISISKLQNSLLEMTKK